MEFVFELIFQRSTTDEHTKSDSSSKSLHNNLLHLKHNISKRPDVEFKHDWVYHALVLSPLDVSVEDVGTNKRPFYLVELLSSFLEALHNIAGFPGSSTLSPMYKN